MKNIILLCLCLLPYGSSIHSSGKTKWKQDLYNEVNQENFRSQKLFIASINLKKPDFARLNAAVFYVTNEKRQEHFLPVLRHRSHLEKMASDHSLQMLTKGFFSHINPNDKNRRKIINRAQMAKIPNPYVAENIYFNGGKQFDSYLQLADSIITALMASPPHRANILNEAALELGCGSRYTPGTWRSNKKERNSIKNHWIITQNFQFYQPIASTND